MNFENVLIWNIIAETRTNLLDKTIIANKQLLISNT